jgi:hypothetical protein
MTAATLHGSVEASTLLDDYLDHIAALGLSGRAIRDRTRIAREFLSRNPDLSAWMALPAAERTAELRSSGAWPLVCYAIGTDRIPLDVELAALKQLNGLGAMEEARDAAAFATMRDAGNRLGWTSSWIETVLGECLAVVLAWHGGLVADLTTQAIEEFDTALSTSPVRRRHGAPTGRGWPACASCYTKHVWSTPLLEDDDARAVSSSVSLTWRWPNRSAKP